MAEQTLDDAQRNKAFSSINQLPGNQSCIDCHKKNPRWASVNLGVLVCIDCAGRHRQYGIRCSFIKSTTLDSWTRKQLCFMECGGNQRALDYFRRHGIVGSSSTNRSIDYGSEIVEKYKTLLSQEVDSRFGIRQTGRQNRSESGLSSKPKQREYEGEKVVGKLQTEPTQQTYKSGFMLKKKNRNALMAIKTTFNFDEFMPDDGLNETDKNVVATLKEQETEQKVQQPDSQTVIIDQGPKDMEESMARETLQKLKQKGSEVKHISSEQFKDNTLSSPLLQLKIAKFKGASSISSAEFFSEPPASTTTTTDDKKSEKLKNVLTAAGEKIYCKLSGYLRSKN